MADENVGTPNGDPQGANAQEKDPKPITLEEINERLKTLEAEKMQLMSTNNRLLDESKKYRGDSKKLKEELLQKEGKWQEIIKMKEDEIEKERAEKKVIAEKSFEKDLYLKAGIEANKRNCPHYQQLMQIGNKSMLRVDDETGEIYGVKEFFDYHQGKEEFSHFFAGAKKIPTNNNTPNLPLDDKAIEAEKLQNNPLAYLDELRKKDYKLYQLKVNELRLVGKIQ